MKSQDLFEENGLDSMFNTNAVQSTTAVTGEKLGGLIIGGELSGGNM